MEEHDWSPVSAAAVLSGRRRSRLSIAGAKESGAGDVLKLITLQAFAARLSMYDLEPALRIRRLPD